ANVVDDSIVGNGRSRGKVRKRRLAGAGWPVGSRNYRGKPPWGGGAMIMPDATPLLVRQQWRGPWAGRRGASRPRRSATCCGAPGWSPAWPRRSWRRGPRSARAAGWSDDDPVDQAGLVGLEDPDDLDGRLVRAEVPRHAEEVA